jgi:hypothetical protein
VLLNDTGRPVIESVRPSPQGATITWRSRAGKQYQLQYKGNLEAPAWNNVSQPLTAVDESMTLLDAGAAAEKHRFYRVMEIND